MNQKPVIAVDVDDVLSDSAQGVVDFSNERWGTNLKVSDYHEHWSDMWGVTHEETTRRIGEMDSHGLVGKYKVHEQSLEVLKELASTYRLIIVTSRLTIIQNDTQAWLEQHYGNIFDEIVFSGFYDKLEDGSFHRTKELILKDKKVDYFIDDQLKHCLAAGKAGIESLLFGDFTWNQSDHLPERVTRVKDWAAVKDYFDARR